MKHFSPACHSERSEESHFLFGLVRNDIVKIFFSLLLLYNVSFSSEKPHSNPPIYIAFLWHMHQPIYFPDETVTQTDAAAHYGYSIADIHNQRIGPYTSWPKNAVGKGLDLSHFGAQVSFSGSLMDNLNNLEANGNGNFSQWKSNWISARQWKTSLNNPRLDMVGFGYFHPLMGLLDYADIRKQIQAHKQAITANFGGTYSKGIFPPENAFSERMIPALVDEGLQWVLVDNIHFDRATEKYPYSKDGNVYEMNKADQNNVDPNDWIALNGLWAPTKNSAAWGRRPHYVQYINPEDGTSKKIIAVPADRYMGNEDGRGGFGALNYENVMSQLESYNTDATHPILIVLHHDGDNYGGGTDSYYGSNFQNFVNWLKANPDRFVCTTIQDYLDQFPPAENDIIHVEDGSWSGADNGDPEFKKWNGDPYNGYSPDRNSWSVVTAAKNFVFTAEQVNPNDANTQNAWKFMLTAEASDYWYWDGSQGGIWDSHPTRASNQAIQFAQQIISNNEDKTSPTIYIPQREPYNPGGTEWNIAQPNNFSIWTYVFDVSGLKSVKIKYRTDNDGFNPIASIQNETFTGGNEVSAWNEIEMTSTEIPSQTTPLPLYKAKQFSAELKDLKDTLVDYFVEAIDMHDNVAKSPIQHVWIGKSTSGGGGGNSENAAVTWTPQHPTKDSAITIKVLHATMPAKLHWGVNDNGSQWEKPNAVYIPDSSILFNGTGPAVQTPFSGPSADSILTLTLGPFNKQEQDIHRIAFVIAYANNTWDNNGNQNYHIDFGTSDTSTTQTFVMDGAIDSGVNKILSANTMDLYVGWNGTDLYVATQSAQTQNGDIFIYITDSLLTQRSANWGKAGTVTGWKYFLGNESSNNWSGWFTADEQQISQPNKAGNILEGTLPVTSLFGKTPKNIYIAIGKYTTENNGTLSAQLPLGNNDGNVDANEWYEDAFATTSATTITKQPTSFALFQNYPNPFNPVTTIRYNIPSAGAVTVTIYDMLGRKIKNLVQARQAAGSYSVQFDATQFPSGVYFYELQTETFREIKRMIFLK